MKGRYRVIVTTDAQKYEFETIIERSDTATSEELNAALAPAARRYLESIGVRAPAVRNKFINLDYEFLGRAE